VGGIYLAKATSKYQYRRPNYFGNSDVSRSGDESVNVALFGEIDYEFTPNWRMIVGGRLDHTDQDNTNYFTRNGVIRTNQTTGFNELVLLPKLGLIQELSPNETIGYTIQQGFRNGGAGVQTSSGNMYTYKPEYLWNYELSYKGSFQDNRLLLSANIFYSDWKDQQVEISETSGNPQTNYITNAGNSTLKGFELEGRYRVTDALSTFAAIGFVDTEFKDFHNATLGDLSGYPFPEAPEWTLALGASYKHSSGFFVGGDVKHISSYLARFGSAPQEYLDSYTIANAQLGYRAANWDITLWAENLFDKEYFIYNDATPAGDVAATLGKERIIGLTLTASF
jgi:outer membrane receptor protein involved in Fe transport